MTQNLQLNHVEPPVNANHFIYGHSANGKIYLVNAKDATGHPAYYFLQVSPVKAPQLQQAVKKGNSINLDQFGHIIASGYGEEVPNNLKEYMAQYFGWQN
jgi:hypothetical protein